MQSALRTLGVQGVLQGDASVFVSPEAEELERVQGYYWDSWDPDEMGRGGLRCKVFAPTLYEPAMAPPGAHVVILQKVLEMDWSEIDDWTAHKRAVEEFLLRQLEELLPGVSARIAVRLSASARTAHRFTLNTAGAMLGPLSSAAQVTSIPTLMAFKKGQLVFRQAGALPAPALEELIAAVRALDVDAAAE